MSYKTILVHCDASPRASRRLGVAAELAERYGAHLVGVHVREHVMLVSKLIHLRRHEGDG